MEFIHKHKYIQCDKLKHGKNFQFDKDRENWTIKYTICYQTYCTFLKHIMEITYMYTSIVGDFITIINVWMVA